MPISLRVVASRLRGWFSQRQRDADLRDEIQAHLDLLTDEYVGRGLTRDHARAAARRDFGGVEHMKDRYRDQRGLPAIDAIVGDVRYAVRMLRKSPVFTSVAVVSLALGIGANTAIFSVLDAVLLKLLPVKNPAQLFELGGREYSYPAYRALRDEGRAFTELFASGGTDVQTVEIDDGPSERAGISLVSGNYFAALGVSPALGRTFTDADDRVPGASAIAVASYRYWQRRFGGDAAIAGRSIRISRAPFTIVGVAPPEFFGERVGEAPDLWVPVTMQAEVLPGKQWLTRHTVSWLNLIGRLKPDVSVAQASASTTIIYRRFQEQASGSLASAERRQEIASEIIELVPVGKGLSRLRRQFSTPLRVLMGAVAFVLLIACANITNLLIARADARRREIGLRLALGISRRRLVQQLLTESLVLASIGGVAGIVFARWGIDALLRLLSTDGSPLPVAIALDARLLGFALLLSLVTGVLFGIAPAWQSARLDVLASLSGRRSATGLLHGTRSTVTHAGLSRLAVIGQVALSIVLVMGAGLFARSLANLKRVDLGFTPERLLVVDVDPKAIGYRDGQYGAFCRRLLDRFAAVPGVSSVTFSENGLLTGRDSDASIRPEGFAPSGSRDLRASFDVVGPRYFPTVGMPVLSGRGIDERDDASGPRVVVINEEMARFYFAGANPIGKRIARGQDDDWEIVGVVRDAKLHGPRDKKERRYYLPYFQQRDPEFSSTRFTVRTAAGIAPSHLIASLQQAARAEDKTLPILSAATAAELFDRTLAQERMLATLAGTFGALAMVLASVGLYGVMAYRVARRTSEIGIRLALGAARSDVLWLVLRESLALILAGLAIGVPLALGVSRILQSLLFGLRATDPGTLGAALLVMTAIGALAGYIPALRAARIEPTEALRCE
jgi:predicted permease